MTLEKIDSGHILVDGAGLYHRMVDGKELPANESHLRSMRNKMGMVFQHFNLFPHLSVLENITVAPIKVLGLSKEESVARAHALLNDVGLADKTESYPAELSGGQKQRVAIARALAMRPAVLLLDEITSALDPELVGEVLDVIRNLAKEHDQTMLFVTHEMAFAREISDRICFLDSGRIVEEGPPEQIFENPVEIRTREFLDSYLRERQC